MEAGFCSSADAEFICTRYDAKPMYGWGSLLHDRTAVVFLWTLLGAVEIPAIVQQLDLPAVLLLECAHQLVAQPLRHTHRPPSGPNLLFYYHMAEGECPCRSNRISLAVLPHILRTIAPVELAGHEFPSEAR